MFHKSSIDITPKGLKMHIQRVGLVALRISHKGTKILIIDTKP